MPKKPIINVGIPIQIITGTATILQAHPMAKPIIPAINYKKALPHKFLIDLSVI